MTKTELLRRFIDRNTNGGKWFTMNFGTDHKPRIHFDQSKILYFIKDTIGHEDAFDGLNIASSLDAIGALDALEGEGLKHFHDYLDKWRDLARGIDTGSITEADLDTYQID